MKLFHTQKIFLVLFMSGFLFGILFANLAVKQYAGSPGVFNEFYLTQFANEKSIDEELVVYLVFLRMIPFLILIAFGFTKLKRIIALLVLAWTGFSCGLLMATQIISVGIGGVLLYFAGVMPHYLLYIPAYFILLWNMYANPEKQWSFPKIGVMTGLMIFGIVLEGYVNPWILKWIIKTIW